MTWHGRFSVCHTVSDCGFMRFKMSCTFCFIVGMLRCVHLELNYYYHFEGARLSYTFQQVPDGKELYVDPSCRIQDWQLRASFHQHDCRFYLFLSELLSFILRASQRWRDQVAASQAHHLNEGRAKQYNIIQVRCN
jgi:hypothetical protein